MRVERARHHRVRADDVTDAADPSFFGAVAAEDVHRAVHYEPNAVHRAEGLKPVGHLVLQGVVDVRLDRSRGLAVGGQGAEELDLWRPRLQGVLGHDLRPAADDEVDAG